MTALLAICRVAATHGRWLLVAGLVAGATLPPLAEFLRGELPRLVALILFLAALRIGPKRALGAGRDLGQSLGFVAVFQIACPLFLTGLLLATGWHSALALALALMFAASPISGSPSITVLTGHDGAPALRVLIAGTALLPMTILPTFWLLPDLAGGSGVYEAAFRLLLLIFVAALLAFLIHGFVFQEPSEAALQALDGVSAFVLAVMVIGLMAAVGPAITGNPLGLAANLLIAFAANFGLQVATFLALKNTALRPQAVGFAVSAGNRNIALFLAALPAAVIDPMLLFIGCYQVPMYLTPLLLRRFYRG